MTSWTDILDAHAEALAKGDAEARERLRALAAQHPDLQRLMDLAERVAAAYRPVQPRMAFRRELKEALLARGRSTVGKRRLAWPSRRAWILGAMASVLSVAGGVGVYLLARRSHAA